jgi:hypothetical protein
MWEPRRLTTLWASTAWHRDSFTFLPYKVGRFRDKCIGLYSVIFSARTPAILNNVFRGFPQSSIKYRDINSYYSTIVFSTSFTIHHSSVILWFDDNGRAVKYAPLSEGINEKRFETASGIVPLQTSIPFLCISQYEYTGNYRRAVFLAFR